MSAESPGTVDGQDAVPGLWRQARFRWLWSGQGLSVAGSQLTAFTLPLIAIIVLDATPGQLGVLRALEFVPFLTLAFVVGYFVDRRRRLPVMAGANAVRGLLLAALPLLALAGWLNIWVLYVAMFLAGLFALVFDIAFLSFVPSLIARRDLPRANGMLQANVSVADIGGPGLGGVLVDLLGAANAQVCNAAAYLASALTFSRLGSVEARPKPQAERRFLADVRAGLQFLRGQPAILAIVAQGAFYNFFYQFIQIIFVVYAIRELGFRAAAVGLMIGVGSLGALAGSLRADWLSRRLGYGRAVVLSSAIACTSPALLPLASGSPGMLAMTFAVAFLAIGYGEGSTNVLSVSLRQALTPEHLMGKMHASVRFLLFGAIPVGALVAGTLGELVGLRTALAISAGGFLIAVSCVLHPAVRRLERLPAG